MYHMRGKVLTYPLLYNIQPCPLTRQMHTASWGEPENPCTYRGMNDNTKPYMEAL